MKFETWQCEFRNTYGKSEEVSSQTNNSTSADALSKHWSSNNAEDKQIKRSSSDLNLLPNSHVFCAAKVMFESALRIDEN